ncbi:hypothetical protein NLX86_14140 [Streptomyces sp. A3M-1-3]|uniref:hypothetical protein n=1 Tax=Streptomyces sp. A3M-1-3 TaxID=2962044 RepID=UPI0020B80091|nr:hypothetical protein [Streptomyces sp. A3M-1-3]MCP3819205.1 hypothetical protein [Streptomyces sp. A3M-1-3]
MARSDRARARARARKRARIRMGVAAVVLIVAGVLLTRLTGGSEEDAKAGAPAGKGGGAEAQLHGAGKGKSGKGKEEPWDGEVKVLGDGSTSYTGPQPSQLKPERLKPGQKPPQFVVFSWDGALEGDDRTFSRFRQVAKESKARMTFFLTGIYLVPKTKTSLYDPPQHDRGAAAISYPTDEHIRTTLEQLGGAWKEGNEIGSHFNGHFCGPKGGGDWSAAEWKSEIEQTYSFVKNWKTNTGMTDLAPLPFDVDRETVGGRAPCLEGQKTLIPASKEFGWRYDASSSGDFQIWPSKIDGIWNFPLQLLPYPGKELQVLAMDFNFLYNQSKGSTDGDPAMHPAWKKETRDAYMNGFERVYNGSRAPLFIGNHFENWNGGIYMDAVEDVIRDVCPRSDVKCVSFRELADWLDAQDPEVLSRLRGLDPAQSPDWKTVID